jgi:hypothetical protein
VQILAHPQNLTRLSSRSEDTVLKNGDVGSNPTSGSNLRASSLRENVILPDGNTGLNPVLRSNSVLVAQWPEQQE